MKVHNYIRYIVSNKPNIRFRYLVVYHPFAGSGTGCSKMAGYLVHCTGYPVCPYQVDSNMLFVVLTVKCSSLVSSTYFSGNTIDRESRDKKAKKNSKMPSFRKLFIYSEKFSIYERTQTPAKIMQSRPISAQIPKKRILQAISVQFAQESILGSRVVWTIQQFHTATQLDKLQNDIIIIWISSAHRSKTGRDKKTQFWAPSPTSNQLSPVTRQTLSPISWRSLCNC